jgi:acyl transferase domain-containing protein
VIGSVKTNIGHLEAAAGIAGLIKVVLSLQHGLIPPHLHFRKPNPNIAWEKLPFEIPSELRKWPDGKKRLAGVSAFGASGTNAHIVLEETPDSVKRNSEDVRPFHILALSAKGEPALKALAGLYAAHLAGYPKNRRFEEAISDVCYTANAGRSHFEDRLTVIGATREEIAAGCQAYHDGCHDGAGIMNVQDGTQGVSRNIFCSDRIDSGDNSRKIAFLFTGQGCQYAGMGRVLYETAPIFRAVMDQCADILKGMLKSPLLDVIYSTEQRVELGDPAYSQPALFAVSCALFELWKSWGIEPLLVMGHDVGEYAAACAAGVFSLEDGLQLVAERSHHVEPASCRLQVMIKEPLTVDQSPQERSPFTVKGQRSCGGLSTVLKSFKTPRIGIVSSLTGELITDEMAQPDYWARHQFEPVKFRAEMETLKREGCGIFLEIGANPVLLEMGRRFLPDGYGTWLPSLQAGQNDWRRMLESLGALYGKGITPDWKGFDQDYGRNKIVLPTYPFQRKRYWIKDMGTRRADSRSIPSLAVHPLLGQRLPTAHRDVIFESRITHDSPSFLGDHQIYGEVVFPATGYVEMALAGGAELLRSEDLTIENFSIRQPLILPSRGELMGVRNPDMHISPTGEAVRLQTILHPEDAGGYTFEIFSETLSNSAPPNYPQPGEVVWRLHATGMIRSGREEERRTERLEDLKARCSNHLSVEDHYRGFMEKGIDYGPGFQGIEQLMTGERESLGFLRANGTVEAEMSEYRLHPGLFDASLQVASPIMIHGSSQENQIPIGIKRLRIKSRLSSVL